MSGLKLTKRHAIKATGAHGAAANPELMVLLAKPALTAMHSTPNYLLALPDSKAVP